MRSMSRRLPLAGLAGLVLFLAIWMVVGAHAQLVASEPRDGEVLERAPQQVRLLFNEPIEPEFFALEVYTSERVRVDRRDARIPLDDATVLVASLEELRPGTYTVVWRVLSIDGHVIRGAYPFTVGVGQTPGTALRLDLETGATPGSLGAAARWLTFLVTFALVGGFGFMLLVLWPAFQAAGIPSEVPSRRAARRFLWIAWPAVVLLLLLNLAALLLQAADVTGVGLAEVLNGRAVTRLLTATKYGTLWLVRMGLIFGVLGALMIVTAEERPGRWARWAGLGFGAAVLLTLSASGHASAVPRFTNLAVAMDWIHMLAGAVWVGGLIQLVVALPAALAAIDPGRRRGLLGSVVRRFSLVAGVSVAVLVVTGFYSSLAHVPSWLALLDTAYGAALSGKLILIAPLLAIAAVNLLIMRPRFARVGGARHGNTEDTGGRRVFFLLVGGEVLLATAILGVTGVLTGLPPATTAPLEGQAFRDTVRTGDLSVTLGISPNQAGTNEIAVIATDPAGQPVTTLERVALAMSHTEMQMGTREAVAEPVLPGAYRVNGGYLSMSGRWAIEVRLRRANNSEETVQFTPVVAASPGTYRPALSPGRILLLTVTDPSRERAAPVNPRFVAAVLFAAAACLVLLRVGGRGRRARTAPAVSAVMFAIGLLLGGTAVADAYRRSLPNPVPADSASLARGVQTYAANCAVCHGDEGRGDGPAAAGLRPRPADFRVHMAAGHTDTELFNWVTNGVDGTPMRGFGSQLSEQERWDVINYIRTFANPQAG